MSRPRLIDLGASSVIGGRSEQQDVRFASPTRGTIGVFDGHGQSGGEAAHLAANFLFQKYRNAGIEFPDDLTIDFQQIDKSIINQGINGGTTATVVRVDRTNTDHGIAKRVVCNNVGDSPALLIDPYTRAVKELTTMHDVTNPDEVEWMTRLGITHDRYYFHARIGSGALMLSRVLGNSKMGPEFTCVPSISSFDVPMDSEKLLLVASDGVINNHEETQEEVVDMAILAYRRNKSMSELAVMLTTHTAPKTHDNATVVAAVI